MIDRPAGGGQAASLCFVLARRLVVIVSLAAMLLGTETDRASGQSGCALSLVLAVDFSSSIDEEESHLQKRGLARALASEAVRGAIKRVGGIQINAFEWSGRNQQVQMVPWTFVDDDFSILKAARMLDGHRRAHNDYPTALGHALGYAAVTMSRAPRSCRRRVIDVSGDGVNNDGYQANTAYRHFPFDGIIVNGLVIAGAEPDPVGHYRTRVLRGPGAFLEIAAGFHDYEEAMRRKLLREILGNALAGDRNRRGRDRG